MASKLGLLLSVTGAGFTPFPAQAATSSAADVTATSASSTQDPTGPGVGSGGQQTELVADEIVVTAQRRTERLEDVPVSVSVLTADRLAASGVSNLRDLANVTSGYQLGNSGVNTQPAIRGITTTLTGSFENNVAVYIDGLYQPLPISLNIDIPNISDVQVLKGPQGTLYGRNATGGAMLLSTINPGSEWKGRAELTYAKFYDKRAGGYVAGPIADNIGVSLAAYTRRSDGYVKLASRTTPGATMGDAAPLEQDLVRVKLRYDAGGPFSANLFYSYARARDERLNIYSPIENTALTFANFPAAATRPTRLGVGAYDPQAVLRSRQHEIGLSWQLETGIGLLRSVTGYSQVDAYNLLDFDGTYAPLTLTIKDQDERTFQQSLDYAIKVSDAFDLLIGGNYFHDRLDQTLENLRGRNTAVSGQTPLTLADYTQTSLAPFLGKKTAWGAFIEATARPFDKLTVSIGGRYNWETQDVSLRTLSATPASVRPQRNDSATFRRFTPRATIRYEFAPRSNVYASYSEGFKSGGFDTTQPACVVANPQCYFPVKEESISAFEIGLKTVRSRARFELAGFLYDYRNLQVGATQVFNGAPVVVLTNAPKARIYGIEGNAEVEPVDNLTVRASATWLHARYGDNFIFSGVGVANAGPGGGISLARNADPLKTYLNITQDQNLSGLAMSRAPDFTGTFGVDYNIPYKDGGLRVAANLRYTSRYVLTNPSVWGANPGVPIERQREQRFTQPGFALLGASVTWTEPSGHFYGRVWGNNLTDHRYRLHYTGSSTYGTYSPMAEPRTVGVTLGAKF